MKKPIPESQKKRMVKKAIAEYGEISPVGKAKSLSDSFTTCGITNKVTFWFNVPHEDTTHNIIEPCE